MNQMQLTIFTIGHSTRTIDEFINLLKIYKISIIADVRTVPLSRRNPQFNKENLIEILKKQNLMYISMKVLGGLRRPIQDSNNLAWENKTFRGYADYMQTKDFTENLINLVALARERSLAVMCAEALPWRCHRNLLSDALLVRKIKVKHILSESSSIDHKLTSFAKVDGTQVTYPLFDKDNPQSTLNDFKCFS
jgi:uncharacterized protein (DUF488 family)